MKKREQSDYIQLNLRIKEPLRVLIAQSALARGVSMNQEMADRLQHSFDNDREIDLIFGSRQLFGIVKIIASIMTEIGKTTRFLANRGYDDVSWLNDPYAYDQAMQAATTVLETLRPPGEIVPPRLKLEDGREVSFERFGASSAKAFLENSALEGEGPTPGNEVAAKIRVKLGIKPPAKGPERP